MLHGIVDAVFGALVLVLLEWAATVWAARAEFVGPWEVRAGSVRLAPLAGLTVWAAALFGALFLELGLARRRWALASAAGLAWLGGGALALGVSGGRHLAPLPLRGAFVLVVASLAAVLVGWGLPIAARASARAPGRCALLALALALGLETANRSLLPRLYPAFHLALSLLTAMLAPCWGRLLPPGDLRAGPTRLPWRLLALLAPVWVIARAPALARGLMLADNLRLIVLARAPLMSMGVNLAAALAPPPPLDDVPQVEAPGVDDRLRLDWREHDILLISVDALRADHVSAYGYSRPTTPHLDALAREGTLFLHAYCPTPHTSYSVTSMMTGKNMRPLLLQGLGSESDTAAGLLRTYGYRTAAFYPPAVFFIDEQLFTRYRDRRLDFEYARIEFAAPAERASALRQYVETQPLDRKLFVWVHLFEPHEPYVAHPEHTFGERDIDRYDSEVAAADHGIGEIVRVMRQRRPNTVVVVTADHGEEFGEHQGRYHGTTVYEEQVRVPLVIAGPGVAAGARVQAPVQTIDVLPTVLAALDIPRPPRVRGRELSPYLRANRDASTATPTPAFAETDEQTLLAAAQWRLVCARRIGACALYDLEHDPLEQHDVASDHPDRLAAMRGTLARLQASHGMYENAPGQRPWPDAIRRGLSGDADAAPDIAALLDDSDVAFRRAAAELLFDLRNSVAAAQLRLTLKRDDDHLVRRWCALGLARLGEDTARAVELLDEPELRFRRLAALALAENGDPRGTAILVAWWQEQPPPYLRARELLAALGKVRAKDATPSLVRALDDIRLRPYVAQALGAIGQTSSRPALAGVWATERYQHARVAIGEALVQLGADRELVAPLVRFLGTPDPLPNGLSLALRARVLAQVGGPTPEQLMALRGARPNEPTPLLLKVPPGGNGSGRRVLVRASARGGAPAGLLIAAPFAEGSALGATGQVAADAGPGGSALGATGQVAADAGAGGLPELDTRHALKIEFTDDRPIERWAELPAAMAGGSNPLVRLVIVASAGVTIEALAVVPLADELPPPPPTPWTPPESIDAP